MLLLLPILFLNSVTSFGFRAIDDPFEYPSKRYIYEDNQKKNFVIIRKTKDELTGKYGSDYEFCARPKDPNFVWNCVETRENGKLSTEPFRCLYRMDNGTNMEMIPGESSQTNNGSIKHYCNLANGGLRKVTEYVPGCYHNGTIYTVGETWTEENPGDKNSSQSVMMGCRRGESGYFEKKVLGCLITKSARREKLLGNGSYIETNETYTYETFMQLNEVIILDYSQTENREMESCVETEPGHVAVVKATEEDVGCTYKNQFHKYLSQWEDFEMGAGLVCMECDKVTKISCLVNGKKYYVDRQHERKLSNGCTFICHDQKNIYKCPDQLSFLEVMKTPTTRIPTTLRAELGF